MARIFTDGAELGDLSPFVNYSNNWQVSAAQKRTGNYSYLMGNTGNAYRLVPALSEFYYRAAHRIGAYNGAQMFPQWRSSSGVVLGSVRVNASTGRLEAWTSTGTLVATGSASLPINQWFVIETHVIIADSGVIQVKLDGILEISFSGDTKPGADTTIGMLDWATNGGAGYYVDDMALNDTSGVVDNSWCGDGNVLFLKPNAAGDVTQLTPSAGANYECVDDIPSDGDTSYVSSPTVDQYDLYNVEAFTPTGVAISRVWAEARARKSQADTRMLKFILKTHAAEYDGSGDLDLLTSHTQVSGTEQLVNPNTSVAWTISELDDLQVGVKVR